MKIARVSDLNDPFELLSHRFENEDLKNAWESSKKKIGDQNGLLCFSKGWQNPVLWSHYGDKHRGICLGFDVPDEAPRHVDYLPERLELKEITIEMAEGFLFSKYKHWEYEEEWRAYPRRNMSNFSKHQELAIWALRYIKGSEAVKDYFEFQKANADFSGEEFQQLKEGPIEAFYQHLSQIDAAITWIEGKE